MTRAEIITLVILACIITLMIGAGVYIRRARERWAWLHPPEDDDGVRTLEDDDPDGTFSR